MVGIGYKNSLEFQLEKFRLSVQILKFHLKLSGIAQNDI